MNPTNSLMVKLSLLIFDSLSFIYRLGTSEGLASVCLEPGGRDWRLDQSY